ncbi:hypothetical protein Sjap_008661 [Stephania japonica]|uniref:Uncharacterized protein n=1 Tax=Stephania japonica TaxID=461633 RepID=A0AAP0PBK3_9MAGN
MHGTKKGNMSMIDFLSTMKKLSDGLSLAGASMSDDDLISNTLLSLDAKYLSITVVLQRQLDLDWPEFQTMFAWFREYFGAIPWHSRYQFSLYSRFLSIS